MQNYTLWEYLDYAGQFVPYAFDTKEELKEEIKFLVRRGILEPFLPNFWRVKRNESVMLCGSQTNLKKDNGFAIGAVGGKIEQRIDGLPHYSGLFKDKDALSYYLGY